MRRWDAVDPATAIAARRAWSRQAAVRCIKRLGATDPRVSAGEVPTVLRADLYALAALAAAGVVSLGEVLDAQPLCPMLLGVAACVFLRTMAIHRDWRVPVARWRADRNE